MRDDLAAFLARLKRVNPDAKVVLTVSPQPPIATYEPRHVLVSATYTKAALRVAADEIERTHPDVWYFPGYEPSRARSIGARTSRTICGR